MSYRALYRTWRPQVFNEVVGQEKTVTALRNAVEQGRHAHAYLFSGPRGTGKTSVAKIMAKALNCENLQKGEPCNECSSCRDIIKGNFMDVVEIDAASNRGIDEIRDLREKVRVLPAQGRIKVYIIDEVHMLTSEAFNALLKTLEEPPESVVFILATTEPHKIPDTIRSRCQSYHFRRLTEEEIVTRLREVVEQTGADAQDAALSLIARRANGGLRDALSIMDQVVAYKDKNITREDILDVLGLVDDVFLAKLVDAAIAGETGTLINLIDTALTQGREAQHLARETAYFLRDLLLYSTLGSQAGLMIAGEACLPYLEKQKQLVNREQLVAATRRLLDTSDRLRYGEGNRFLLEVAFLELAEMLGQPAPEPKPQRREKPAARKKKSVEEGTDTSSKTDTHWQQILTAVKEKKITAHALLVQGRFLGIKENTVYVGFDKGYKFHKERLEEKANREIVLAALKEVLNRDMTVEFIFIDDQQYNDIVVKQAIEFFGEEMVEIKD